MYNTGNPLGSTAPKDFSDNSEITDRYVNDVVNETTQDRFGRSRLTIHGQQEKARRSFEQFESDADALLLEKKNEADNVIANLGFFPPVDYTTGLTVDSRNFTVTYNGVVYAAQPSAVPFTTGAWDAAQWYPIQNVLNQKNLLVFDTYAEASAAAATLPDGQVVYAPDINARQSYYKVESGSLTFQRFAPELDTLPLIGAEGDGVTNDTTAIASVPNNGRKFDGLGKSYLVDTLPTNLGRFKRAAFRVGRLLYPTADFFQGADFAKATNARAYTAWPQDSAYVMGNKIRAFVNYGDAHLDGDLKCSYITSEDGGTSWSEPVLLLPDQPGWTCWSAGYAGGYEMAIVRLGDVAPWRYRLYRREMPENGVGEENTPWVYYTITFPMPAWATSADQPVMVHSFCVGHDGRIVVGLSFGEGAALAYSTNGGITWLLGPDLLITSDAEEPTVKYENGIYCGFLRGGNTGSRPRFWISRDNLATIQVYSSTAAWFGSNGLQDATVPLQIKDGIVHAFTAQRSGTLAGQTDDKPTPAYYIRADLSHGDNIWSHADIFEIGTLWHMELGGASACGQGSVVLYQDRVIALTGSEERTGAANTKNRRANVWALSLPLKSGAGLFDQRRFPARDASANNPFIQTASGFAVLENKRLMTSPSNAYSAAAKRALAKSTAHRIIDGGSGNTAHVIATDGSFADWTSETQSGTESGWRVDNTSGTILFRLNGTVVGRWDASANSFRPEVSNTSAALGGVTTRWATARINKLYFGPSDGPNITSGLGSPQGVVTAPVGSIYTDGTGGGNPVLWIKESGSGATGWVSK